MTPPPVISGGVSALHSRSTCEVWPRWQGRTEHFPRCPSSVGTSRCHCGGTLEVSLRQELATSFSWLHECHSERCMGTHKVIVSPPPFQMGQELWSRLRRGPGAACQRGHPMTDGQID